MLKQKSFVDPFLETGMVQGHSEGALTQSLGERVLWRGCVQADSALSSFFVLDAQGHIGLCSEEGVQGELFLEADVF